MKRSLLYGVGLGIACALLASPALLPGTAQAQKEVRVTKSVRVHGKVVRRVGTDRIVVHDGTRDVTLHVHPRTRFIVHGRPARIEDIRVGTPIQAEYVPEGERYLVNSVTVPEATGAVVETPAVPPVIETPAEGEVLEGEVVRVVGNDQVVLRTPAGREQIVYVGPETVYRFHERPGRFVDVRPGVRLRVNYRVNGRRFVARRVVGVTRR